MQLPMQLMISMIVAAMTVSMVYQAVEAYSQTASDQEISRQVNAILIKIEQVRSGADGTALRCDVSLPDRTDYVKIGGDLTDETSFTLKYHVLGRSEGIIVFEGIRVTGKADGSGPMTLYGPGSHSLILTYFAPQFGTGQEYVLVSA